MRRILFTLVQLTWGLPQTLLGFALYLYWLPRATTRYVWHGAIVTEWTTGGGISLGLFVFVSEKASRYQSGGRVLTETESKSGVRVHEYGHCVQSLLLGPLYLLTVGIPSYAWANLPALRRLRREKRLSYYAIWPEKQANALGEWATGEKSIGQAMPARRTTE